MAEKKWNISTIIAEADKNATEYLRIINSLNEVSGEYESSVHLMLIQAFIDGTRFN